MEKIRLILVVMEEAIIIAQLVNLDEIFI